MQRIGLVADDCPGVTAGVESSVMISPCPVGPEDLSAEDE